jgi:hypothetical protein
MRILLLLFFILVGTAKVQSQQDVIKAKIIWDDHHVLDGYVRKNFPVYTPQQFDFSKTGDKPFQTIAANNIKRIELSTGRIFEKYNISIPLINKNYIERKLSDYQKKENQFNGNLLIEKVITGSLSLYLYIDKYRNEHFFYKEEIDTSLIKIPNITFVNESGIFNQDNTFKNMLKQLVEVKKCSPELNQKIEKLEYDLASMLDAFRDLNACSGTPVDTKSYTNRIREKFEFGIIGGVTSMQSYPIYYSKWSTRPTFGVFLQILPSKGYTSCYFNFEAKIQYYRSERTYPAADRELIMSSIDLDPCVRIFFHKKSQGFFMKTGANLKLVFSFREELANPYSVEGHINLQKGLQMGFIAGGGYDFRKVAVEGQLNHSLFIYNYNVIAVTARVNLFAK